MGLVRGNKDYVLVTKFVWDWLVLCVGGEVYTVVPKSM